MPIDRVVRRASRLSGRVRVPPDKSLTHRSIFFSALAEGTSTIHRPLQADDCLSTARCMEALGARIEKAGDAWTVRGVGTRGLRAPEKPLDCGNSGTTMRLIAGLLAGQNFRSILTGDASLSRRPMRRIAEPLEAMGAKVTLQDGHAPVRITGTKDLRPIAWKSDVASAQVKSSVLLAGLQARGTTSFEEPAVSRDHTERMLAACGVPIRRSGTRVEVTGPASLRPLTWTVPGDISSAAFLLVAGLLAPGADLVLEEVNTNPTRTGILDVLQSAGAEIRLKNERDVGGEPVADIAVKSGSELAAFSVDRALSPRLIDEVPVLAIAATQAKGRSVFSGLEELRHKETDRLKALASNLSAMGASVQETPDGLVIDGPRPLKGARVPSFDDHRIAMAFAVAGLIATGDTTIEGSEAVAISFPDFWSVLERLQK